MHGLLSAVDAALVGDVLTGAQGWEGQKSLRQGWEGQKSLRQGQKSLVLRSSLCGSQGGPSPCAPSHSSPCTAAVKEAVDTCQRDWSAVTFNTRTSAGFTLPDAARSELAVHDCFWLVVHLQACVNEQRIPYGGMHGRVQG